MLKPSLLDMIEKSEPFGVAGIGNFWPVQRTKYLEMFYVEFFRIPPHLHKNTTERFFVLKGRGKMTYGPPMRGPFNDLGQDDKYTAKWEDKKLSKTTQISPFSRTIEIPPYTPHEMKRDKGFAYVGTILICEPPLDPKDEIGLRTK